MRPPAAREGAHFHLVAPIPQPFKETDRECPWGVCLPSLLQPHLSAWPGRPLFVAPDSKKCLQSNSSCRTFSKATIAPQYFKGKSSPLSLEFKATDEVFMKSWGSCAHSQTGQWRAGGKCVYVLLFEATVLSVPALPKPG